MDRYKKGENRYQVSYAPLCLDDMVAEDSEVRMLEAIIEKMDVRTLGFTHSQTKDVGRKACDPEDMFKLYAYSYFNGIRSSRKIERECRRNIELMWLVSGLAPDFKTIADFRKDNKEAIREAFKRFGLVCDELGLVSKEMVAVDGSKFRACNSRLAYHSKKKIEIKIEHHSKMAEQYVKLLEHCDDEEHGTLTLDRQELQQKLEHATRRVEELLALKEIVLRDGSVYDTDPDARMMKNSSSGVDICHNVQVAVEGENHLVVAVDVTSQAID